MYKANLQFNQYYHMYNRGNNKEALFKEDRNYHFFLDLYKKYIYPIADLFFVQWKTMKSVYPKAIYVGRLR